MVMSFDGPETLLSMLNEECEAIAAEVGAWLHNSPASNKTPYRASASNYAWPSWARS